MRPPATITLTAHAKVNLALAVGPPIADGPHAGFHPVCSWMHAIALGDTVRVERLAGGPSRHDVRWEDGTPAEWPVERDLGVRAHRALEAHAGRELPASVRVTKRVPVGGGLGGGSSDAASVLLALDALHDLALPEADLHALGARLGSDVPFFIDAEAFAERAPPRPAIVSGLGERVERLGRRSARLTLVVPPFECPTGEVYRAFDRAPTAGVDEARVRRLAAAHGLDLGAAFNDLADAACAVRPGLAAPLAIPCVRLSGSGSVMFAPSGAVPEVPGCRLVETELA